MHASSANGISTSGLNVPDEHQRRHDDRDDEREVDQLGAGTRDQNDAGSSGTALRYDSARRAGSPSWSSTVVRRLAVGHPLGDVAAQLERDLLALGRGARQESRARG